MTTPSLSSRAVIATLNVGAWRTTKTHAGETRAVNAKHAVRDAATVVVDICDHPALTEIAKLHAEARAEHYRLTLPAADKGLRLLPVQRQIEHADMVRDYSAKVDTQVAAFLADYETERAAAPARLNGLYVAAQWPTRDAVAEKFRFQARYLPVPDGGQWQEWMTEAAAAAHEELLERLREAITKVAAKLADPKAIFRDTLVSNLADLLAIVPDLNIAADPTVAAMADKAKALLEHDADTLREDPTARADVAAKAQEIVNLFNLS